MAIFPGTLGADVIYGTDSSDTLDGLGGDDHLFGLGGDDAIDGGDGSDVIFGGTGADTMTGGLGNDYFEVDNAGDRAIELLNGGSDLVFTSIDYTLADNVERLAVFDASTTTPLTLTGNALDNEITGNAGNNLIIGGGGADLLRGGAGDDTYVVDSLDDIVGEVRGGGYDTVLYAGAGSNTVHNYFDYSLYFRPYVTDQGQAIEHLGVYDQSSTNVINLHGSISDELITGNDGINYLDGGRGNDSLAGYGGDDAYFIYTGTETLREEAGGGIDTVFFNTGFAGSAIDYTLPDNFERIVTIDRFGRAFSATGNALDNELSGNAAANTFDGKEGSDLLIGYGGNDTFRFTTALGPNNVDHLPDYAAQLDVIELDHTIFSALAIGRQSSGLHRGTGADLQAQNPDDHLLYDTVTGNLYYDADANGPGEAVLFAVLHEGLIISAADIVVI